MGLAQWVGNVISKVKYRQIREKYQPKAQFSHHIIDSTTT